MSVEPTIGSARLVVMQPRALPATIRHRPFDVRTADRVGVTRERLRRRDLVRPTRSIRWQRASPPEGVHRIRAFRPVLLPGQFVSHTTAALLWELPLPRTHRDGPLHVTSRLPAAQPRRIGVVGHRVESPRAAVRDRWGVPASTPAMAWVECGALLELDDLVVLGDAIVTESRCRTDVDDLRAALLQRGRCRGARRLRAALDLIRRGAGSSQETRARLGIVRAGLPEPDLQVTIHDEHDRFLARVDMAYPDARIVIEYEGDHHRTDPHQWAIDIRRHRGLGRLGWIVLRWTKADLDDQRDKSLAQLGALLRERGYRPQHGDPPHHRSRGTDRDGTAPTTARGRT